MAGLVRVWWCAWLLCWGCTLATITDTALYDSLVGDWEGELRLQLYCNNATRSCAFQLILGEDHSFQMMLGPGCFVKNVACGSEGAVTDVTSDTITVAYSCPANGRGCFCEDVTSIMDLCWKFEKTAVMTMNVAMHLSPYSKIADCPTQLKESCDSATQESIGLGILDCAQGDCVVCKSQTSCSGRGRCDKGGQCQCFPGWSGSACNVSDCPNACSAHGLCDITKTKVLMGFSIYDKSKHAGVCRCVSGWSGYDCSSPDVYTGRQALWQGLIFIGIVSTVATFSVLLKKFSHASHIYRRHRHRLARHHRRRHHIEVELDEFINPM